ncbi:MAG: hypothetical protein HON04_04185, partial [Planctomicrobium sp.]|nr:hypothetical protein [Planctomicrobium sp.]
MPTFSENSDLTGQIAVVVDILRASTTIVHALANGARSIRPCSTVEQAWKLAEQFSPQQRLLGGERHCQTIEGFDLDNSPLGYTSDRVADRVGAAEEGAPALHRGPHAGRLCGRRRPAEGGRGLAGSARGRHSRVDAHDDPCDRRRAPRRGLAIAPRQDGPKRP